MMAKAEVEKVASESAFAEAIDVLGDRTLTIEVEANEQGHLFKAIKADDVVSAAAEEGVTLLPNQIVIKNPIKELGGYTVTAKSGQYSGTIELDIVAK